MTRRIGRLCTILVVLLAAPAAAAAQQGLPELGLEDLMRIDAGRVFGASERSQPVTEAPASVSFITADEIARHGYRTLAEILRGVRGLYVTDDRNFSLLGARGFAKPGDYNSRILLLVNGHRVNDNVFGQAEIGAEFGLDPAMIERVEIIRGPASSVYGDSAFFGVVNVITRTGASLGGGSVALESGTLGAQLVRVSAGRRLFNGVDFAFSGVVSRTGGVQRLYFPEFDTPANNNGVAEGLDGERVGQFYSRINFNGFTVTGAYGSRQRDVPTASYGVVFNEQHVRLQTTDRHTLADIEYRRPIGAAQATVRASFDRFTYDGIYPRPGEDSSSLPMIGQNVVVGARWSVGGRVTRPLPWRQLLTLGAEFIDNVDQDQALRFLNPPITLFSTDRSSTQQAVYLQDEIRLARWLIVNAGLRYDGYDEFSKVTPRTALIVMPSSSQSFKYLYGRAFRAPNEYELNAFYFGPTENLRPESIDTHEFVWERYAYDWLRTTVSTYWYKADRLITLSPDPSTFLGTTFKNQGEVQATGLELEGQMRFRERVRGLVSYALQRATDQETHASLTNSPRHMAKVRMSVSLPVEGSSVSGELLYLSSRRTLAGNTVGSASTANLSALIPVGRNVELVGSIQNMLNDVYADPVSDQHLQDSIPQNGRTFRAGLRWTFWAK